MTSHNGSIRRFSLDHQSAGVKKHECLSAVILDGMCQFVALLNPEGDIVEVNRAALEGAGHKIEEIRGKPIWTARWWQVSEQIKQDLQAAIRRGATGEFVHYEVGIFGDQSGRLPITMDLSLQPIRGESGEVEYLLVEGRNITERNRAEEEVACQTQVLRVLNHRPLTASERKRAEEAMRHRSDQYETLLNQAPLGVFLVDADFRIREVNPVALPVFGDIPNLIGRDFDEVIYRLWTKEYADEIVRIFRNTLRTGESYFTPERAEFRIDRGVVEYYEWRLDRILLPDGRHGVACYFRDISAQVQARDKIRESEERYRELARENQRLYKQEQRSREAAESATHAKDEFLAIVSHELRAPLNSILSWNQMMRKKKGADPYIAQVAEAIERCGQMQLQLIEELLDTARIVSGKMHLKVGSVELSQVIASAIATVRTAAEGKGVVIIPMLDPEAGQITGDANRLQQVVWNLLSNAIKFTPTGGLVHIELRRGPSEAQIVVRDTGEGIAPDLLPYVFDRFRQDDSSTPKRLGGLGLGLAIVKHLVELHGGRVSVESPCKGMGATFTVSLPVIAALAEDRNREELPVIMSEKTSKRPADAPK